MSTIAAIATPPGKGGVGIIRLSGNGSAAIARKLCRIERPFAARVAQHLSFYDSDGATLDSGLLLYFPAPASYTGEDVIELQAHGSPVLLRALLDCVLSLGARLAEPGEFTRRAVEHGKLHLEQAEAIAACIDAATLRAARQAMRHLQGEFGLRISTMMDELTGLVAHVEACLDFPEEDIPALLFEQLQSTLKTALLTPINESLASADFGERLFQGVTVAIVGAPNVGKSTLLNRLSGRDRAIVSEIPGTTRDILEIDFEIHGIPVRLQDTAGIRKSEDKIEQEGVRRAQAAARCADIIIAVADASSPDTWHIPENSDTCVMNKSDLCEDVRSFPQHFLPISAASGEGVDSLLNHLAIQLGEVSGDEGGVLVTNRRHRQQLEYARDHLLRGEQLLGEATSLDLVALEWRQAWSCMGEILGIGDIEHILDRVFSQFCIGK